nr:RDD family protein [Niveibacterium umoris]
MRPTAELAGLRRRLACMLYEALLLLGVCALGWLLPQVILGMAAGMQLPGWLSWLQLMVVLGIYFLVLWRRNGQTLAMQTWQLQIVDARTGRLPNTAQCLARYLLGWPSILFCGAGIIWSLFDRDHQFLHDRFAGTCVVLLPGRPGQSR